MSYYENQLRIGGALPEKKAGWNLPSLVRLEKHLQAQRREIMAAVEARVGDRDVTVADLEAYLEEMKG